MTGRLRELLAFIRREKSGVHGLFYADTGPIPEKSWGARTALGWMGKHSNLISRDQGSWFFLGVILLDCELEYDEPAEDHCGTCIRCISACPTGAIVERDDTDAVFEELNDPERIVLVQTAPAIRVGIGEDKPKGKAPAPEPVPATFDYETWLGPAPQQPYMEDRVHPQTPYDPKTEYGRPGWITTEDFGLGMITNWGAHHVDIAHWGMGMELGGPTTIEAKATFMTGDVWTVHHTYHVEMVYPNGVLLVMDNSFPNGVRFEGTEGWIFVSRGNEAVTASDPQSKLKDAQALAASDPKIITSPIGANETHLYVSTDHHGNWLDCVQSRKAPITSAEIAHRSCTACLLHHIAMRIPRHLRWDPAKERFANDDEANAKLARPMRAPYTMA